MMQRSLEPFVTFGQALNVTDHSTTIGKMTEINYEKQQFAKRFNELCDDNDVPPKGSNRQAIVGKIFGVTQKGARKWLEGESIPGYEICLEICKKWNCNFEWLYRGVGPKHPLPDFVLTNKIENDINNNKLAIDEDSLEYVVLVEFKKVPEHLKNLVPGLIKSLREQEVAKSREVVEKSLFKEDGNKSRGIDEKRGKHHGVSEP